MRTKISARVNDKLKHIGHQRHLVMGQGLTVTIVGVGIELAGSFALTRFLSSLLFEVSPNDPMIIAGVVALMILVALAACYIPTRRAQTLIRSLL